MGIDGTILENYNANDLQDFFKKILISKRVKLNNLQNC